MLMFHFLYYLVWKEIYLDLNKFGRVIMFPIFVVGTLCLMPVLITELITVDIFVFIYSLMSTSFGPKDVFEFFILDRY